MKISTKGRYGLRALVDLAVQEKGRPVLLREIAIRQDISRRYLERLFSILKTAGIIRSIRGAQGGYLLAKRPETVNVAQVIEALEGPLVPVDCLLETTNCKNADVCFTREVWLNAGIKMREYYEQITLAQLVEKAKSIQKKLN